MKKAVIYARVSSKEQEREGFSIPAQIKFLTEYAEKNLFVVDRIFKESETAKKAGRKAFNEMLLYLKEKNINTILVEKTDRLYRNFKDYIILEDYDLDIHLVKEGSIISKNSKSHDKFIHGIKVLIAKNYIDNLSEEVKKGIKEKVEQGHFPGKAPVGYLNIINKEGKHVIDIDPKKAPFIKKLFELYASGAYSVADIRKMLYEEGFNHNGKPWSKPRLLFVLKDVFYIGKFLYKGVIYQGSHKPIIDLELYNNVQKMFNQSKARTHDVHFDYTGLIKCGHCGCQLTAELKKGKYIYYHCTGKRGGNCKKDYIRQEQIDDVFKSLLDRISKAIPNNIVEELKIAIKEMQKVKSEYEVNCQEQITKQINILNKRIDNLYMDKLDGRITEEYWTKKNLEWHEEKDKLINKLSIINKTSETFYEGSNLLIKFCKNAQEEYLQAKPERKIQILKIIGSNFVYKDKKLSVELSSVFDTLLNLRFSQNGGTDEARTRDLLRDRQTL